jgi:L-cystine transport system permease protein
MRPFHPEYILTAFGKILWPYILVTLGVTLATVILGSILGFGLAVLKIKNNRIGRAFATSYIYIIRCIPSIILLFVVYYGLPFRDLPSAFFVIITLTLLFSASMAEVFRSAYNSIPKGQTEAALTSGLSSSQSLFRIVIPQAAVSALPNFTNSLVSLLKEGSLAYTIGLIDVMGQGQLIIGRNNGSYSLEVYIALFAIYWILIYGLEKLFAFLETKLSYSKVTQS